jgi:hypothetical protein
MMKTETGHPKARTDGILTEALESGEIVVYDLDTHDAHTLSPVAAQVWKLSDGTRSESELADEIADRLDIEDPRSCVTLALSELNRTGLVAEGVSSANQLDRRQLLARIGAGAAAATVLSVVAPRPAAASTCIGPGGCATSAADCCNAGAAQSVLCGGNYLCP